MKTTPLSLHELKYHRGFLWLGILVYERWNMPGLSHCCAVDLMALEINYPEMGRM
jgi:hypothetical protein